MARVSLTELDDAGVVGSDLPSSVIWKLEILEKKANYQYWLHIDGKVEVFKDGASEPTYTVENGLCSCRAASHGRACKHVKLATFCK